MAEIFFDTTQQILTKPPLLSKVLSGWCCESSLTLAKCDFERDNKDNASLHFALMFGRAIQSRCQHCHTYSYHSYRLRQEDKLRIVFASSYILIL